MWVSLASLGSLFGGLKIQRHGFWFSESVVAGKFSLEEREIAGWLVGLLSAHQKTILLGRRFLIELCLFLVILHLGLIEGMGWLVPEGHSALLRLDILRAIVGHLMRKRVERLMEHIIILTAINYVQFRDDALLFGFGLPRVDVEQLVGDLTLALDGLVEDGQSRVGVVLEEGCVLV